MDRETLASDVLENWTPETPDVHPDDVPTFDTDGAPILRCPMTQERPCNFRDGSPVLEPGAIEGAGGTWWRPKSSAWSVEPSRIRALSPRGRAWLKATHARAAHYATPGETDQRTGPLAKSVRSAERNAHRQVYPYLSDVRAWVATCAESGAIVLRLKMPRTDAQEIVDAYGIAGRPLTLRPA